MNAASRRHGQAELRSLEEPAPIWRRHMLPRDLRGNGGRCRQVDRLQSFSLTSRHRSRYFLSDATSPKKAYSRRAKMPMAAAPYGHSPRGSAAEAGLRGTPVRRDSRAIDGREIFGGGAPARLTSWAA